jgi:hypothetical protein
MVSENAIRGVTFPEDASAAEFDLSIEIRPQAVLTPLTDPADNLVAARMVMRAEGDYAFCAVPKDSAETLPSIGSILITDETLTPEVDMFDTVCDDL